MFEVLHQLHEARCSSLALPCPSGVALGELVVLVVGQSHAAPGMKLHTVSGTMEKPPAGKRTLTMLDDYLDDVFDESFIRATEDNGPETVLMQQVKLSLSHDVQSVAPNLTTRSG
jgi:hypothetical protein